MQKKVKKGAFANKEDLRLQQAFTKRCRLGKVDGEGSKINFYRWNRTTILILQLDKALGSDTGGTNFGVFQQSRFAWMGVTIIALSLP